MFYTDRAIELAAEIVKRTPFDRVYFANSGTEANEALLKLARRWHYEHGRKDRVEIVACDHSFHGRTYGSLSITGQPKYHVGMTPLLPGIHHVPFDDLEAMRRVVSDETAAIIVEPIQAEGGVIVPSPGYLAGLRQLADERGALLFFDEVQTGYGRTGRFLGAEHDGVVPDACSLAKGIAGGFPLGAIAVTEKVADGLPYGSHASTFGGNPLACAAGLAVLRIFEEEGVLANVEKVGAHLRARLEARYGAGKSEAVAAIRGRGLLQAVALADAVDPLATLAAIRDRKVLVTLAGGSTLRLAPPLIVSADEIDEGLAAIDAVLADPPRKGAA
jgi:acetylornithine/succinyldiaminopimelate/putrescine aminotransferase